MDGLRYRGTSGVALVRFGNWARGPLFDTGFCDCASRTAAPRTPVGTDGRANRTLRAAPANGHDIRCPGRCLGQYQRRIDVSGAVPRWIAARLRGERWRAKSAMGEVDRSTRGDRKSVV